MFRTSILALLLLGSQTGIAQAKAPHAADNDLTRKLITFDEVLAEIRKAHESGDWKTAGWKPLDTKNWLDHLLTEIKRVTKREKLALPVEFEKVKPAMGDQRLISQQNMLIVMKDGQLSLVRQSIILADGNVEITQAENCIIIARGAVTLSSSQRNLIVAGQYASVSYDRLNAARLAIPIGANAPAAPAPGQENDGSVILSAGILEMSSAYGTICCGLDRVMLSIASQGAMLINSPHRELSTSARLETFDDPQIPFTRKAAPNLLQDKLTITQIVSGSAGLVVLERNGVEYVLRPGAAITDERGQPIAGLENWKLQFLGRNYAQFAKDRQYASFYVKR